MEYICRPSDIHSLPLPPSFQHLQAYWRSGMLVKWLCRQHTVTRLKTPIVRHFSTSYRRYAAISLSQEASSALDRTRNIGIIAHIDAVSLQ